MSLCAKKVDSELEDGLKEFPEIRGILKISKMENVVRVEDALQANMKDKRYMDELSLNWKEMISRDVIQINGVIDNVLSRLQPHPNLKQLSIKNYPSVRFPNWLGDPSVFSLESHVP